MKQRQQRLQALERETFQIVPCCGYKWNKFQKQPYPVFWNPGNQVVQCHNCGQVWEPKPISPPSEN